jgi:hypothetical protein
MSFLTYMQGAHNSGLNLPAFLAEVLCLLRAVARRTRVDCTARTRLPA